MLIKLSAVQQFLSHRVAPALRMVAGERDQLVVKVAELTDEVAGYRRQHEIEKIARTLENKPGYYGTSLDDRVEWVTKRADAGADLATLKEAASMLTIDGSAVMAAVKTAAVDSKAAFEQTILSGR